MSDELVLHEPLHICQKSDNVNVCQYANEVERLGTYETLDDIGQVLSM